MAVKCVFDRYRENHPVRCQQGFSGQKGEQGDIGPPGKHGVDGLPGPIGPPVSLLTYIKLSSR